MLAGRFLPNLIMHSLILKSRPTWRSNTCSNPLETKQEKANVWNQSYDICWSFYGKNQTGNRQEPVIIDMQSTMPMAEGVTIQHADYGLWQRKSVAHRSKKKDNADCGRHKQQVQDSQEWDSDGEMTTTKVSRQPRYDYS